MGERTAISWTDHSFNPWWGCERVSPGCLHCYAETFAKRTGHDVWGKRSERRFFGDKHWLEPLKWNAQAEAEGRRHRVFCASMADVFEDRDDLSESRSRLFDMVMFDTPWLDWQLLTKRPENVSRMVPPRWLDARAYYGTEGWPANAWIGTTVEDQQRANERIPVLLSIPASVRFLSCEPLLGSVVLRTWIDHPRLRLDGKGWEHFDTPSPIHWVICGGESGPHHRPLDLDHARSLRDQCAAGGVAFFFKQHGGRIPTAGGDELDGRRHKEFPTSEGANHGR